jgi:YfiH family protein
MSLNLLSYANLNHFANEIRHFSSTRTGGTSSGEFASLNLGNYSHDLRENIDRNRQLLCDELDIPFLNLIGAHQVHSAKVILIDEALLALPEYERKASLEGYDAVISRIPGICITATTADCVPILLFDPVNKAVAAIHSGWKGTLENITGITIDRMQQEFSTNPKDLVAAIGPCISGAVYEVGEDLVVQFQEKGFDVSHYFHSKENSKFVFDIRLTVAEELQAKGVKNIELSPHCTYSEPELFFSARRQGILSGRLLSGIGIID